MHTIGVECKHREPRPLRENMGESLVVRPYNHWCRATDDGNKTPAQDMSSIFEPAEQLLIVSQHGVNLSQFGAKHST